MSKNTTKKATAPKPKRGVGQAVARQRRKVAERQQRLADMRRERERDIAASWVIAQRNNAQEVTSMHERNYSLYLHAVNALTANHAAFHSAIGLRNIEIDFKLYKTDFGGQPRPVEALTDFSKVMVRVGAPTDTASAVRDFVTKMRGVLHHETGHCRFTVPYNTMIERVNDVVDDHPIHNISSFGFRVWNMLEDQRMETAVVQSAPRIANYFIPMVAEIVLDASTNYQTSVGEEVAREQSENLFPWLAIAGRRYLPAGLRKQARDLFDEYTGDRSGEWETIINKYCTATTEVALADAIVEAYYFVKEITNQYPQNVIHDTSTHNTEASAEAEVDDNIAQQAGDRNVDHYIKSVKESKSDDEASEDADGDGGDGDAGEGDEDSEGGVAGNGPTPDEDTRPSNSPSRSSSSTDKQSIQDALKEVAEKAHEKASQSAEVDAIMSDIRTMSEGGSVTADTNKNWSYPMADHDVAKAVALSSSIYEALDAFRTAKSAALLHRQEEGYLDPLAYRTREPGEVDYHNNFVNLDANGLGLHVSLLADRSTSMMYSMRSLSVTTYALHKACKDLGIPSTMVLWADLNETGRVYETSDEPLGFQSLGGTQPRRALNDLDSHVTEPGLHHLVFIFTDGEWYNADAAYVNSLKRPDRTIVAIGLNCGDALHKIAADEIIDIPSMEMLGGLIYKTLVDRLAAV